MLTVAQLILDRFRGDPGRVLFYAPKAQVIPGTEPKGSPKPAPEGWVAYDAATCLDQLSGFAKRLTELGVTRGSAVAIVGDTCHAWTALDLANQCLGAITVGVYPSLLGPDVAWQVNHAGAVVLIVQNRAQYDKIQPHLGELGSVRHVLAFEPDSGCAQILPAAPDLPFLEARVAEVQPDDIATIIYTSGTTGNPKGVVLTQRVMMDTVRISAVGVPVSGADRSLAFLPLAHILQRFATVQGLSGGVVGYYCTGLAELPAALLVARPTLFATVPRFLEKVKAGAEARAAERGPRASALLSWAVNVGKAFQHARREGYVPLGLKVQHAIADRVLLSKIRARLGGSLRLIVSGGAALNPEVNAWFEGIGIPVREVWGLTETCGPATMVPIEAWRPGTVGPALSEVELRLDTDGEVQVRGPNVFRGYYKDPDATAAAMTEDGYFRTGDIGRIDEQGYLKIVDRKKELIVTAGGKNIPPVNIEKKLEGGLLGQAVVIGSERPYLVALFAPDPEVLAATARERGWTGDLEALSRRPELRAAFQERVDEVNATLASYETIKRFAVLPAALTQETGELTPTLKLKRRIIAEKYRDAIEALYEGAARSGV